MEDEREEEEEVMFVNTVQGEMVDSGEDEEDGETSVKDTAQTVTTPSDEELEDEIKRTQVAVDECYRRRAKRAGIISFPNGKTTYRGSGCTRAV
jgi:hypothetical protein